MFDLLIPRSTN